MEDIGTKTTPINNYLESLTSSITPSTPSGMNDAYLRMPSSSSRS